MSEKSILMQTAGELEGGNAHLRPQEAQLRQALHEIQETSESLIAQRNALLASNKQIIDRMYPMMMESMLCGC